MDRNIDRVSEALTGELGKEFKEKTRERINWIVNRVSGLKILDIGTSQGAVPIILGREGKYVDAIDIEQSSIEYAQEQLSKEHQSVQKLVNYKISNFMIDEELESDYDTVLLTEVLEHISDTQEFLKKVSACVKPTGKLIITVPFGVNDYFDHKRTYYISELKEQLQAFFDIVEVEFLGKWTGVVCKLRNSESISENDLYSVEKVKKLERAFYCVEKEYLRKIEDIKKEIPFVTDTEQAKQLENERIINQRLISAMHAEYQGKVKSVNGESPRHLNYGEISHIANKSETSVEQLIILIEQLSSELGYSLDREKETLNEMMKILNENSKLKEQLKTEKQKYYALRNSKLGKMTVKYWKLRKKF